MLRRATTALWIYVNDVFRDDDETESLTGFDATWALVAILGLEASTPEDQPPSSKTPFLGVSGTLSFDESVCETTASRRRI